MEKLYKRINLLANLTIIVVGLLLSGIIIQKYFLGGTNRNEPKIQPQVGSIVNLPGIQWSEKSSTLVLALQKDCRHCTASAPFYKRLLEIGKSKNIKIVAALPGPPEESAQYLNNLGLNDLEIKQSSLKDLKVGGTPTLILTNEKGEITSFWIGRLSPEKENEVIGKL